MGRLWGWPRPNKFFFKKNWFSPWGWFRPPPCPVEGDFEGPCIHSQGEIKFFLNKIDLALGVADPPPRAIVASATPMSQYVVAGHPMWPIGGG
jgi:hypothetical protein